tara:strand:- start:771 stop:1265 length:495 start_codon:yes stop_codon:yes gene_type:complete
MIDGTYSILYLKWEDVFLPIGLLTSEDFSEDIEMLDTTTRDNGGWKTSTPTNQSYSLSFEGLIKNTNFNGGDFTKISLDRLRTLKRNRILIEWKTQDKDSVFIDSGFGYITSLSKSSTIDEFISFSANIQGYGVPLSTSGLVFTLEDGNNNIIEDGNNNEIITG